MPGWCGSGTQRQGCGEPHRSSCGAGGDVRPAPSLSSTPLGFTLTMRMDTLSESSLQKMGLNERQILAVERIKVEGSITSGIYQSLTGVSAATAFRDLKALVDLGVLEQVGPSRRETRYILRRKSP